MMEMTEKEQDLLQRFMDDMHIANRGPYHLGAITTSENRAYPVEDVILALVISIQELKERPK